MNVRTPYPNYAYTRGKVMREGVLPAPTADVNGDNVIEVTLKQPWTETTEEAEEKARRAKLH